MPARSKTKWRPRLAKLWKQWGVFFILVAVVLVGGVVALALRVYSGGRGIEAVPPYKVYFTQGDIGEPAPAGLEAVILEDIDAAGTSVDLATPGLDLPTLAGGLIAAKERGVTVRVLEDASTQEDPAVLTVTGRLREAGIEVVLRQADGALGGAFIVVDGKLVWAGSWDLSQQGLTVDDSLVLRWSIPQLAQDFQDEFAEMFSGGAYGAASPADTKYKFLALPPPITSTLFIYMTPEDDPFGEILRSMAQAKGEIVVLTAGLDDQRLGDRLIDESSMTTLRVWGILGSADSSKEIVQSLIDRKAGILAYRGRGRLRESFILIDGRAACIFSQGMKKDWLDRNDGYVIVLWDQDVGALLQGEFGRLVKAVQSSP